MHSETGTGTSREAASAATTTPMSLESESPRSVTRAYSWPANSLRDGAEDGEKMGTEDTNGRRRDLAARTMAAWAWGSVLQCTTAAAPSEAMAAAMAASETVSMGEATQGIERGTRRERRLERSTASAGKPM
uniref:Cl34483_1a n=1 Tax=Arundo donax TaxID=35708 RepID=A0A0A9FKY3_ARUDO